MGGTKGTNKTSDLASVTQCKSASDMRVAQVLLSLSPEQGGVFTTVVDLTLALHNYGLKVSLLESGSNSKPGGSHSHLPECIQSRNISADLLGLNKSTSEILPNFDVFHLHTPWCIKNIALARMLRKDRKPYCVSIHGMLDQWSMRQKSLKKRVFLRLFGVNFLKGASQVHCTAELEREQVLRLLPGLENSITVIPCFVNLESYLALSKVERKAAKPTILFLSRLHPKKGCEILIDSAKILLGRGIEFVMRIAGGGDPSYLQNLRARVKALGLDNIIHFEGLRFGTEKLELYRNSDVFALPTLQENFGIVYAEALASGTPIVTSPNSDIVRELTEAGSVITENSPLAFAIAIEKLLLDSERRRQMAQQGVNFVRQWLDPGRVVQEYVSMYRSALLRV